MANFIDYCKYYGDKSFSEVPFNDVDALILAELSYLNFSEVISTLPNTIEKVSRTYFNIVTNEKIKSKKSDFTVCVLVKPGEEVNFEKYRERTKNEFALMRAKKTLSAAGTRLENDVKNRDLYVEKVEESAKYFEECRQEVARLEKLVEEEKGNEQ